MMIFFSSNVFKIKGKSISILLHIDSASAFVTSLSMKLSKIGENIPVILLEYYSMVRKWYIFESFSCAVYLVIFPVDCSSRWWKLEWWTTNPSLTFFTFLFINNFFRISYQKTMQYLLSILNIESWKFPIFQTLRNPSLHPLLLPIQYHWWKYYSIHLSNVQYWIFRRFSMSHWLNLSEILTKNSVAKFFPDFISYKLYRERKISYPLTILTWKASLSESPVFIFA